ncbi:MAG: phytanoyl-CoA dioxygenase family protein [Pseudomonadales bacterium]
MTSTLNEKLALIERYSAQNRARRSAALELQLVELRREAAQAMLTLNKEGQPAKTSIPDLFAGCGELPEIQGTELTVDTLAAGILNQGALLVRSLFSAAQVQYLLKSAEHAPADQQAGDLPLGCSPGTLFDLLEIYQQCGLLQTVRDYLGDEPVMFAERAKLRRHYADRDKYAAIPWHQDVNFFGTKSYAVNCWAAITPCGEDNPGLSVIPRRTEQRHGWQGDGLAPLDYGKRMPEGMMEELTRDYPIATPVFRPGDAILFDEMTIHSTAAKPWKLAEQIVAISWFFRASQFPAWGTPLAV